MEAFTKHSLQASPQAPSQRKEGTEEGTEAAKSFEYLLSEIKHQTKQSKEFQKEEQKEALAISKPLKPHTSPIPHDDRSGTARVLYVYLISSICGVFCSVSACGSETLTAAHHSEADVNKTLL